MKLYFKETGTINNETIVFIHGGGLAGWIWDEQVKSFKDYHCIVPDLPEHGKSAEVNPFSIHNAANMVIDLIRAHAHEGKAHLVGLSLGSQIILQILATNPEMIRSALITGTIIRRDHHIENLQELLDYTYQMYEPVKDTRFFIKANMRMYNISKDHFNQFKESTLQLKSDSLRRILNENLFFKIPEGLNESYVPVMIIIGEKDYKVIKESASDLKNAIPNSKSYFVPRAGHVWNLESPELFNSVLRSFITGNQLPNQINEL